MRISTHTPLFAFLMAITLVCVFAQARAGEEPVKKAEAPKWQELKPERLVSDATLLYIYTPDLRKTRAAFEHTAFRGLLNEEEVAGLLIASFAKMQDVYIKGDGTRNDAELRRHRDEVDLLQKVTPYLDGQIALAIEPDSDIQGLISGGKLPRFLLIASMPSGDKGVERRRLLDDIFEKHRYEETQDAHYKDFDEKTGPYDVHRIENSQLGVNETWAFVENLFVYGQGKHVVEDAIGRFINNGAGTLLLHAGYQTAYQKVGRDERGEAQVYLQVDIHALLKQQLIPGAQKLADSESPQIALGLHVGDGENAPIKEKILFRMSKDSLPKTNEVCTAASARFAPGDTLFYSAQQSSLAQEYQQFIENIKAKTKDQPDKQNLATSINERVKLAFGVQNDADLAGKMDIFKGEFGLIVSNVPHPNLKMDKLADFLEILQPVLAIELDKNILDQSLSTLLTGFESKTGKVYEKINLSGVQISCQKDAAGGDDKSVEGQSGMFVNLFNPPGESSNTPFFAAYARVELESGRKFLLLSDNLNALKKIVQQSQPKFASTSLEQDKKFKNLTGASSFQESRRSISYVDMGQLLEMYNAQIPRLSKPGASRNDLFAQMPSVNALREHMFPMAWAVIPDTDGVLIEFSSPLGIIPMVAASSAVAWPSINAQRMQAVSDEVDAKFKRIFLALHLYAADFDSFPPQLSILAHPNYLPVPEPVHAATPEKPDIEHLDMRGAPVSACQTTAPPRAPKIERQNFHELGPGTIITQIALQREQPTIIPGYTFAALAALPSPSLHVPRNNKIHVLCRNILSRLRASPPVHWEHAARLQWETLSSPAPCLPGRCACNTVPKQRRNRTVLQ